NAAIFGLFCLAVAIRELRNDFRNPSTYAAGLGVLLVVGAYWGFTRLDPRDYQTQLGWNMGVLGRLDPWSHPSAGLSREIHRWVPLYATTTRGALVQIAYGVISAISVGALVAVSVRRRGPTSGLQPLVATYAVCAVLGFAFFNNLSSG